MNTTAPIDALAAALADRYTFLRELGHGGMATVYLAEDLKHERQVAVKVLRPELSAVVGAERFLREIRVTAGLQHPHLLPLFDSGEWNGQLYYVMPYVDGESLRARLEMHRQLSVEEVVQLGVKMAGALEHAHRKNIIHRDLKPENILLQDGEPLIADFGISLAVSRAGGERVTQTGMSLGTPHYMSPEQASGDRVIDTRSDVYSLGAMLYECLSGEPPHTGGTLQAIIAKVIADPPRSLRATRSTVPVHVEAAILRALEKVPADRWRTAGEFAEALQGKLSAFNATSVAAATTSADAKPRVERRLLRAFPWIIATAGVTAAVVAMQPSRSGSVPAPALQLTIGLPDSTAYVRTSCGLDISRDGRRFVYVGRDSANNGSRQLYVRDFEEPQSRAIPGTLDASCPRFSPDGERLSFHMGNAGYTVALKGGAPTVVVDSMSTKRLAWWGDRFVIGSTEQNGGLNVVDPATRAIVPLFTTDSADLRFESPVVLDDGETVLFAIVAKGNVPRGLGIGSLSAKTWTRLDLLATDVVGTVGDFVLFVEMSASGLPGGVENRLVAARVDFDSRRVIGAPVVIGNGIPGGSLNSEQNLAASVSANGTLLFASASTTGQLLVREASGDTSVLVSDPVRGFSMPAVSPDGRYLAYQAWGKRANFIYVYDTERMAERRLSSGRFDWGGLAWTPDSRSLVYGTAREQAGVRSFVMHTLDATTPPDTLLRGATPPTQVTADGRALLFADSGRIGLLALDSTRRRELLLVTRAVESRPYASPSRRWLVYTSTAAGTSSLMLRRFGDQTGAQLPLGTGDNLFVSWLSDDRLLITQADTLVELTLNGQNVPVIATRTVKLVAPRGMPPQALTTYDAKRSRFYFTRSRTIDRQLNLHTGLAQWLHDRSGSGSK